MNRLHAEKLTRRKDAAEAQTERKRKRKAKHDKACKIARLEGKPRPATPESTSEEEEDTSDAEGHLLGNDGVAAGASSPPTYQWDVDEGASAAPEETRTMAGLSADPSLGGAERESSPPAAGEVTPAPRVPIRGDESAAGAEMPMLTAPTLQADPRGHPRDSLRGVARCRGPEEAVRASEV